MQFQVLSHLCQCFFSSPRKKNFNPRKFSQFCPRSFQSGREKNLESSPRKKNVPEKKKKKTAREKKNPSREKNDKFCPRKLKKYPRKNMLKKSDMIFFSCYFWDCGGLMLRRFFLDFFNAFVKTILSLFWPNFVRACGELAIMSCLNCVRVCTGPLRL